MPSVAREKDGLLGSSAPVRRYRCLSGSIHGEPVFRLAECEPRALVVSRRPGQYWVESGWFCEDLLDE